jgi:hypothetical protein
MPLDFFFVCGGSDIPYSNTTNACVQSSLYKVTLKITPIQNNACISFQKN